MVVIVPVVEKEDGEYILFLITKRPPLISEKRAQYCLEMPAGLVGDINTNEDILSALKRELKEESGYETEDIKIVSRNISSSAGMTSETSTVAIAKIDSGRYFDPPCDDDGGVIAKRKLVKKRKRCKFYKRI